MLELLHEALGGTTMGWRLLEVTEISPGHDEAVVDAGHADRAMVANALRRSGLVALRGRGNAVAIRYDEVADRWLTVRLLDGGRRTIGARPALRHGLGVCFLAPDGAGKSTLVAGLMSGLPFPVSTVHMELYGRPRRGPGVPGLRFIARVVRQWRRWLMARGQQARGRLVLFDRYPYDALLNPGTPLSRLDRLRRGVLGRLLPAPDLAIVLDAPARTLYARKQERPVHELELLREQYRQLAGRLPCRTTVIDGGTDPAEVRHEVTRRIWAALVENDRARARRLSR